MRRDEARAQGPGRAALVVGLLVAVAAHVPAWAAGSGPEGGDEGLARATFAGGCFWCVEQAFDGIDGVVRTTSGFTGGHVPDPTYEQVSAGGTGHYEAVEVAYDPDQVGYEELLQVFWHNVDPSDAGGQFCDRGPSYRTAIFAHDERQRALAEASKREIEREHDFEVVTPILEAGPFHPADASHQDYHLENPVRYRIYKWRCGRQERLEEVWGEAAPH